MGSGVSSVIAVLGCLFCLAAVVILMGPNFVASAFAGGIFLVWGGEFLSKAGVSPAYLNVVLGGGLILQLIAATTTNTGLIVTCDIDANSYPKGIPVTDAEMAAINLELHPFHGEWNYTIKPREHPT